MPTIPTIDQPVQPNALPGERISAQVSPEAAGAPLARGLASVGNVADQIYQEERQKADEIALMDADRKLGDWENKALYDPQTGALNRRGQDSFGLPDEVMQDFTKQTDEISAGLATPDQKLAFQHVVNNRRQGVDRAVQTHVAGERRQFDHDTFTSLLDTSLQSAVANANDRLRVSTEVGHQMAAIDAYAQRQGMPEEWTAEMTHRTVSGTYRGVIENMLANGQDLQAKKMLGVYNANLIGEDRTVLEAKVEAGSRRDESRTITDDILGKAANMGDALAALESRKVEDTKVYDLTKTRIEGHYASMAAAKSQEQDDVLTQAHAQLVDPNNPDGFAGIDVNLVGKMDAQTYDYLQAKASQMAKREKPVTNRAVFLGLQQMAAQDPGEFAKPSTLIKASTQLSDDDFEKLATLQREVIKQGTSGPLLEGVRTRDDVVESTLRHLFDKPKKDWSATQKDTADRFAIVLDKAVVANQKQTKQKLSTDEVQQLADRLVLKEAVTSPRGWYNPARWFGDANATTQTPAFQIAGAERQAFSIAQVPQAYRQTATTMLQGQGVEATEERILSAYNADVAKQAGPHAGK